MPLKYRRWVGYTPYILSNMKLLDSCAPLQILRFVLCVLQNRLIRIAPWRLCSISNSMMIHAQKLHWNSNFHWFRYACMLIFTWIYGCLSHPFMFTIECKVININSRHSPSSLKHVSLWCVFWYSHHQLKSLNSSPLNSSKTLTQQASGCGTRTPPPIYANPKSSKKSTKTLDSPTAFTSSSNLSPNSRALVGAKQAELA